ncbi:MAG: hypothetical protein ABUL72_06675 [Armatimonadota bacterium]
MSERTLHWSHWGGPVGSAFRWLVDLTARKEVEVTDETPYFPAETVENLNGEHFAFPADLPADRTLALIAFLDRQKGVLNSWVERMDLTKPDAPAWVEFPLVTDLGETYRDYVNGVLKEEISQPEHRSHVFTLSTHVREFCRSLGLTTTRKVYAVVLDRRGKVVAIEEGKPTTESIRRLKIALSHSPYCGGRAIA